MGLILGIDLGVSSIGTGIIDSKNYDVIDYGVRLVDEASSEDNLKRRTMRGSKRLKSRRTNRKNEIKRYLERIGYIKVNEIKPIVDIYDVRVKGLNDKLTHNEVANAILNIAKHRGSSLEVAIDEDNAEDIKDSSILTANTLTLKKNNLYVCEHQLKKVKEGKLRSHENVYKMADYEKELRKMLSVQGFSDNQINDIVIIVTRRRDFSEGPGSEKFPTKYGSYREEYIDGKKIIRKVNLIEEMRGKCSIFENEPRVAKNTYTACLFNLLNDLNNLTYIKNEEKKKLTKEQKEEIISIINQKGKFSVANLAKYLDVDKDDLQGLRVKSNGKDKILTTFDVYSKFISEGLSNKIVENKELFDEIIELLTKTNVIEKRIIELKQMNLDISNEEIEKIASLSKINGYHSLSKKAMKIIIEEMLDTNKNQMQIITDNNLGIKQEFSSNDIQFNDKDILSSVAKRIHRQCIRIINELRKKYGEFESIVIETTRAKNGKEEKKQLMDLQKKNEEKKAQTDDFLLQLGQDPSKINTITRLKLMLYKEQDGKTIYSGEPIDLNILLTDPTAYQIEHIIPYAISFDNSLNNKALASEKENKIKGKRTPFAYFSSGKAFGPINTFEKFKSYINSMVNISKKKKEYLLTADDYSKFENMEEFTQRNLIDTSYAIRSVMNTLKAFFKGKNINTNVFVVRGKMTNAFRARVGLEKDRDKYIHHAVDALIIAGSAKQEVFKNAYSVYDSYSVNNKTGEVIDLNKDPLEDYDYLRFVKNLKNIDDSPYRFSYKVDFKTNRQISDETIYSTRNINGEDYVVKKFKDIYGKEGESLKKFFDTKTSDKLLMYKNDKQTYDLFLNIYNCYKNEKNPFLAYKNEHGPIRKYSKNGYGPIINQVKYIDGKLISCLDVSRKYNTKNNKKVVLLQTTAYRTDFYISPNGVYKMLTVRIYHVKQIDGVNVINESLYESLKEEKNIKKEDKFLFSLNRNNIVGIVKKDNKNTKIDFEDEEILYRFIATNSDKANIIELKLINQTSSDRIKITIGKSIAKLIKYNVSPIGEYQKVEEERLKLKW